MCLMSRTVPSHNKLHYDNVASVETNNVTNTILGNLKLFTSGMSKYFHKWLIALVAILTNGYISGTEDDVKLTGRVTNLRDLGHILAKEIEELKRSSDESSSKEHSHNWQTDFNELSNDNCSSKIVEAKSHKRDTGKITASVTENPRNECTVKSKLKNETNKNNYLKNEPKTVRSELIKLDKRDVDKDKNVIKNNYLTQDNEANCKVKENKVNKNTEYEDNIKTIMGNKDTIIQQNENFRIFRDIFDENEKARNKIPLKINYSPPIIFQDYELINKKIYSDSKARLKSQDSEAPITGIDILLPQSLGYLKKEGCENCNVECECNFKKVLGMSRVVDSIFEKLGPNIRKDLGICKKSKFYDQCPIANEQEKMDKIINEMVGCIKQSLKWNMPPNSCSPLPRDLYSFLIWLLHGSEGGQYCPPVLQDIKTRNSYLFHEDHHQPHICGSASHADRGRTHLNKVKLPDTPISSQQPRNEHIIQPNDDPENHFSQNRYGHIQYKDQQKTPDNTFYQNKQLQTGRMYSNPLMNGNNLHPETKISNQNIETSFRDGTNELSVSQGNNNSSYSEVDSVRKVRNIQEPLHSCDNYTYNEINDHKKVEVLKNYTHKKEYKSVSKKQSECLSKSHNLKNKSVNKNVNLLKNGHVGGHNSSNFQYTETTFPTSAMSTISSNVLKSIILIKRQKHIKEAETATHKVNYKPWKHFNNNKTYENITEEVSATAVKNNVTEDKAIKNTTFTDIKAAELRKSYSSELMKISNTCCSNESKFQKLKYFNQTKKEKSKINSPASSLLTTINNTESKNQEVVTKIINKSHLSLDAIIGGINSTTNLKRQNHDTSNNIESDNKPFSAHNDSLKVDSKIHCPLMVTTKKLESKRL